MTDPKLKMFSGFPLLAKHHSPADVCNPCVLCALFAVTGVSIREELGSRKFCCSGSGLPDYVQYPFNVISFKTTLLGWGGGGRVPSHTLTHFSPYVPGKGLSEIL